MRRIESLQIIAHYHQLTNFGFPRTLPRKDLVFQSRHLVLFLTQSFTERVV